MTLGLRAILSAAVGGVLALAVVSVFVPRLYAATGTIVFPLPSTGGNAAGGLAALVGLGTEVPSDSAFPLDTYVAVLTSERALFRAADLLDIKEQFQIGDDELLLMWMRQHVSVELRPDRIVVVRAKVPGTPDVRGLGDILDRSGSRRRDQLYRDLAPKLVRTVVDQMKLIASEIQLDRAEQRKNDVEQRLDRQRRKLEELRDALVEQQTDLGSADPARYATALAEATAGTRETLAFVEAQLAESRRAAQVAEEQTNRLLRNIEDLPGEVNLLRPQREAYQRAKAEHERLAAMYGPENPDLLEAARVLREQEQALRVAARQASAGLVPDVMLLRQTTSALEARRAKLLEIIAGYDEQLADLPRGVAEQASLQAEVQAQTELIKIIQADLMQATSQYEQQGVQWSYLDEPRTPLYKESPRLKTTLLLGLAAGLLVASWPLVAAAYGRLFVDDEAAPAGADPT